MYYKELTNIANIMTVIEAKQLLDNGAISEHDYCKLIFIKAQLLRGALADYNQKDSSSSEKFDKTFEEYTKSVEARDNYRDSHGHINSLAYPDLYAQTVAGEPKIANKFPNIK